MCLISVIYSKLCCRHKKCILPDCKILKFNRILKLRFNMEEATSKGGLSRFSVSLSSKQTDRKSLINNDQGSNQFKNYTTLLSNNIFHFNGKSFTIEVFDPYTVVLRNFWISSKDGDMPASGNVDDSPSSPTDVSAVSKVSGSNYGSVPKERKSRFRMPKRGNCRIDLNYNYKVETFSFHFSVIWQIKNILIKTLYNHSSYLSFYMDSPTFLSLNPLSIN